MRVRIMIVGAVLVLLAGIATVSAISGPSVFGIGHAEHDGAGIEAHDGEHDCGDHADRQHDARHGDHDERHPDQRHHDGSHDSGDHDCAGHDAEH